MYETKSVRKHKINITKANEEIIKLINQKSFYGKPLMIIVYIYYLFEQNNYLLYITKKNVQIRCIFILENSELTSINNFK